MGKILDKLCTNCGLVSFSVDHFIDPRLDNRFCGVEACEVAQSFFFFEEILGSCADFLEGVGREGRGKGCYLTKTLKEFSILKTDTF